MANGNPFYVNPLGGYNPQQGVQQIVGALQAKSAQEKQEEQTAMMNQEISEAFSSNNPALVSQVMLKYPKQAAALQASIGFKDKTTEKNFVESAKQILAGADPEKVIADRIQFLTDMGADPSDSISALQLYRENPEAFMLDVEMDLAGLDPKAHDAWKKATGRDEDSKRPATASIKDWEYYKSIKNPEEKEAFGRLSGILDAIEPDKKPKLTSAQKDFQYWQTLPDGPEKQAFAKMLNITPRDTAKTVQERAEKVQAKKTEIINTSNLISSIDDFLGNKEYVDFVTGLSGKQPFSLPGTQTDATAAFETLMDNLTLGNLDKMTGVLTDRDISLLASAASGVRKGMSREGFIKKMNEIKDLMSRKLDVASEGIPISTIEEEDDLSTLSDDDLLNF